MVRPLLASAATLVALGSAVPRDAVASDLQHAVLREINRTRAAHHRGRLRANGRLGRAASHSSHAMAGRGKLAHAPDWARPLRRAVPTARLWAQNLALIPTGSAVARGTVRAWLHSPPHRHTLLSPKLDLVGLGTAHGRQGVFVTADFAGR